MYEKLAEFVQGKKKICVIQAENPDGDSLGTAVALDYLLGDLAEPVQASLYCPVDMPKYLHYIEDWSRVTADFDFRADGYIIVDTAAALLLSKLLEDGAIRNRLYGAPVLVLDHHESEDDLEFPHESIIEESPACAELLYRVVKSLGWQVSAKAAECMMAGISSDTLGLTTASVSAETFRVMAELMDLGADVCQLDEKRREFMKKSPRILDYKADLIRRVEYCLDGQLAAVHIPWEEIREYSNEYNPNVLILEELRMVEGVKVAVAIKTYPDGRITGKIRTVPAAPVADKIAAYFGGGGHPLAAGFRAYDYSYDELLADLIDITAQALSGEEKENNEDF